MRHSNQDNVQLEVHPSLCVKDGVDPRHRLNSKRVARVLLRITWLAMVQVNPADAETELDGNESASEIRQ